MRSLIFAFIILVHSIAFLDLAIAGKVEKKKVCLEFAKAYDPKTDKIYENQSLLMEGDTILDFKPSCPDGVKKLSFKKSFVIPGLIDMHTHIFLKDVSYGENPAKAFSRQNEYLESDFNIQEKLRSLLREGFTEIRDLGNSGYFQDIELRDKIKDSLDMPTLYVSGQGISFARGQFDSHVAIQDVKKAYFLLDNQFRNPLDEILKVFIQKNVDVIKLYADNDPAEGVAPFESLSKVVQWANLHKKPIAAHAILKEASSRAIGAGVNTIEHGLELDSALLKKMALKKISLIPTDYYSVLIQYFPQKSLPASIYWKDKACDRLRLAQASRVNIAFGSDNMFAMESPSRYASFTKDVLLHYVKCGLSAKETLHAATINAARAMGIEGLGYLGKGAMANIIILDADPLKDVSALKKVRLVIKKGQVAYEKQ